MEIDHNALVFFSKSWGLLYLGGFAVCVVVYTFWPSNKKRFVRAKESILDPVDKPWQ
jgi:cytochrome c oxidase cbb3-type subunit 4